MDPELKTRLSPAHLRRLAWFEDHAGEVTTFPDPLDDGLLLVCKAKGIYKPKDLTYVLSIRINRESPYADGVPVPTPGGGWLLAYHQEDNDRRAVNKIFTNIGLMQCMSDRVPVGVLRERPGTGRPRQYDVLGLAKPARWLGGYFLFESIDPLAKATNEQWSNVLESLGVPHG